MSKDVSTVRSLRGDEVGRFLHPRVGKIVELTPEGRARVTFAGSHGIAIVARSVIGAPARAGEAPDALVGDSVLLVFEEGDPKRPIVVGLLRDELRPEPSRAELSLDMTKDRDVIVDGQRLVFDAKREILLRCGKSSVLLRRDGKVLIRGAHLVSRSSGPNKIKGGSISLN